MPTAVAGFRNFIQKRVMYSRMSAEKAAEQVMIEVQLGDQLRRTNRHR